MGLSTLSIEEFITIYEKEFGIKLSYSEAEEAANDLLGLYKIMIDSTPKGKD